MTIVIVGDGIAGQAAAVELLERGMSVEIVTRQPASASESAARRGGFDVDDDPERHAEDLDNPDMLAPCEAAGEIFERLLRLDVPFAPHRALGLKVRHPRSAHVGSATAHHVSRRLSARIRHFGCVPREGREVVRLILDDASTVRGVLVRERQTGRIEAIAANAVCLATGGYAGLFDPAHPARGRGSAIGCAFRQGAPMELSGTTTFELGYDAGGIRRALPEVLFANGANLRKAGNVVEFDAATTSFHDLALCVGSGAELDLSSADSSLLTEIAGTALDAIQRHHADGAVPVHAVPARALGGLRVDAAGACDLRGLYATGGASARFHRERSAGGNALLVDLWAARVLAERLSNGPAGDVEALDPALVSAAVERMKARAERALIGEGECPYALQKELARLAVEPADLAELDAFADRLAQAACPDANLAYSPAFCALLELEDSLLVARAVAFAKGRQLCVRWTEDGRLEQLDAA